MVSSDDLKMSLSRKRAEEVVREAVRSRSEVAFPDDALDALSAARVEEVRELWLGVEEHLALPLPELINSDPCVAKLAWGLICIAAVYDKMTDEERGEYLLSTAKSRFIGMAMDMYRELNGDKSFERVSQHLEEGGFGVKSPGAVKQAWYRFKKDKAFKGLHKCNLQVARIIKEGPGPPGVSGP